MIAITQKYYGIIEVDNTEKDIIKMFMVISGINGDTTCEVIFIERQNIDALINALTACKGE